MSSAPGAQHGNMRERNQEHHRGTLPLAHVDRDEVVEVEAAPLLHVRRARGAEEGPAHTRTGAGEEQGGQLISEAPLPALEQLVRLIHHKPLHPGTVRHSGINIWLTKPIRTNLISKH